MEFFNSAVDTLQTIVVGLGGALCFLGDRTDPSRLLPALDVFVRLSHGEDIPHVVAEAGMAGLATVAASEAGARRRIVEGAVQVRVTAPPADGAANDAVLAVLAAALDLPRRDLTLLRGAAARIKLIGIALD